MFSEIGFLPNFQLIQSIFVLLICFLFAAIAELLDNAVDEVSFSLCCYAFLYVFMHPKVKKKESKTLNPSSSFFLYLNKGTKWCNFCES